MSDDRLAQARVEAARDAFYQARWEQKKPLDPIRFGVRWADANPQPSTITRHDLRAMVDAHVDAGATGDWVSLDDMMVAALATIGIGVDDCASTQEEANP